MSEIIDIINDFKNDCSCKKQHLTTIKDICISSGALAEVGNILKKNNFSQNLLLVADKNTFNAANGIVEALSEFNILIHLFDNLRIAKMEHVDQIVHLINDKDISVVSIGTGSINDTCRLACAKTDKLLCIFATAPSMDGFASDTSPIVNNGFKLSYKAKSPEVIIGDTKILANAPNELKSAGFGDMMAKYIGITDWQISNLLIGEYYCEKVAKLTETAVNSLILMADSVTDNNEITAGKIFESLLMTGVAMSFTGNSRPASGSEHIISHLMECLQLNDKYIPNYHGEDVGVCTLEMLKYYHNIASKDTIRTCKEDVDWNDIFSIYGPLSEDIKKLNFPTNIIDLVSPEKLKLLFPEIKKIINKLPSFDSIKSAMLKAGCKTSIEELGVTKDFFDLCVKYSPYMRKRITLLRLQNMIIK